MTNELSFGKIARVDADGRSPLIEVKRKQFMEDIQ
jgi:hypothetical protein